MSDIDPTTGLPELPEGYRWRVHINHSPYEYWPHLSISLEKKGLLFWSTKASYTYYLGWEKPTYDYQLGIKTVEVTARGVCKYFLVEPSEYAQLIREQTEQVLDEYESNLVLDAWHEKYSAARKILVGKYPPKKLEQ